ncbi:hypothetical protein EV421DRAFT_1893563 [Armillaria borealis]|uniref:Uncharacterized protein n=1 Tax=Armillaria borealis TaxID=47425 RepID=A0AA39IV16_9AGAR|nr:hypothetical protein EV421DRAFT_1893563 [Armillaria borealis]
MPPDKDDVVLGGVAMDMLAQADDTLLLSLSARGLQLWCLSHFIVVNRLKTVIMVYGLSPSSVVPEFTVGEAPIHLSTSERYVGVTFQSQNNEGSEAARYSGHCIMGLQDKTGRQTPTQVKLLYNARVDCYLTHACEIMPDAMDTYVEPLIDVQKRFWHRVLRLGRRSMITPLHSETDVIPLRPRRFLILLGYLKYLLSKDGDKYARAALENSRSLAVMGKSSWFKDVNIAGSRLKFGLEPIPLDVSDPETIDDYRKILTEIGDSRKLYLLHDRKEPKKGKAPGPVALKMRIYLEVTTPKHRDALVSIVLSTHNLAVERLRRTTPATERENILCRMCMADVETPEHILFRCIGNENSDEELGADEENARVTAKYCYRALKNVYKIPMYRP